VGKIEEHRAALKGLADWLPYLNDHSGLPGPRGNLELVAACGEEADVPRAEQLIATGDEFATVCGVVALGRYLGLHPADRRHVEVLRRHAADSRWRVREGVAMAVQRAGDDDPELAFALAESWGHDPDPLVRRAAVAAVCEPRLLRTQSAARRALELLDGVTGDLARLPEADRRSPSVRTLRQALGYGWSVAIAALAAEGLRIFAELAENSDPDIAWIVRENSKKKRLRKLLDGSP
jgi:hypothetical protein